MFDADRWKAAPMEIIDLIRLTRVQSGARVLDLCCGPGRHAIPLAQHGFTVTGVDLSAELLKQAEQKAKTEGAKIEWIEKDMREFVRPEAFDLALSLFTSFGYFEESADDVKTLKNVCRSLKTGGMFVIDLMGKEVLARIFEARRWRESQGAIFLEEAKISDDWGKVDVLAVVIEKERRHETPMSIRLYSGQELRALLTECGFKQIVLFGDFQGNPYDHRARRLVALARK